MSEKSRVTVVSHTLAAQIGLDESIALAQVRFLVGISKHERDGKRWTYQSLDDLQKQLPFWNRSKIYRLINKLAKDGYVEIGNYNRHSYDRTSWYAITEKGEAIFQNEICISQNEEMHFSKMENAFSASETTIPEVTTEATTDASPSGAEPSPIYGTGDGTGNGAQKPQGIPISIPSTNQPAIALYVSFFGIPKNDLQKTMMAEAIEDMERWRAVLTNWKARNWRADNVPGLIDSYRNWGKPKAQPQTTRPRTGYSDMTPAARRNARMVK